MIELRHMRYFTAVAEELHFGRAARRLCIAQSALSAQIRALEQALGVKLFERTSRNVSLTLAGSTFYEKSRAILHNVQDAVASTQIMDGRPAERFVIGSIHAASFGLLPSFLDRLARKFPAAQIRIRTGTTETIIREIERGEIQLGFVRPFEQIGTLRYHALGSDVYRLAIPSSHPLADAENIRLSSLAGQKLILFARDNLGFSERHFAALFKEAGLDPSITYRCDDTLSLMALVAAGLGIAFLPEWTASVLGTGYILRDVEDVTFRIGLGLVWNLDEPFPGRDAAIEIARAVSGGTSGSIGGPGD